MPKESGPLNRFIKEPAKEILNWTWKLAAAGTLLTIALGKTMPAVKLAMLSIVANIGANEIRKSMNPAPTH